MRNRADVLTRRGVPFVVRFLEKGKEIGLQEAKKEAETAVIAEVEAKKPSL